MLLFWTVRGGQKNCRDYAGKPAVASGYGKANESYYLLKKTAYPTVIVECGFLSNSEEAAKLSTGEYQEAVAEAIADGILDCLGNETVDTEEAGLSNETADTEKQKTKQH